MLKPNRTAVALVTALAGLSLAGAACGADATADDPPKSRARIVADACHAAYAVLQNDNPSGYVSRSYDSVGFVANYAYFVAFTADYCEAAR